MASRAHEHDHSQTSSPKQTQKSAPPAIRRIIAELGLRYRPISGSAVDEHRAAVELLIQDLSDIPAERLDAAAREWVRSSSFMPRAADLVRLVQQDSHGQPTRRADFLARMAERGNENLDADGRRDIRWIEENGSLRLIDTIELRRREERARDPANAALIAQLRSTTTA